MVKKISCLNNLSKCGSACCKNFAVRNATRDSYYITKTRLSDDLLWYYELHGATIDRGKRSATIDIRNYRVTLFGDKMLRLTRNCDYLKDGKCLGHPNKKPLVCQDFGTKTTKQNLILPGCIYNE